MPIRMAAAAKDGEGQAGATEQMPIRAGEKEGGNDMGKVIAKATILVPLSGIYLLLTDDYTLSIREISLFWGQSSLLVFYITVTVLWLCSGTLREICCDGGMTEIQFNLVPIFIWAMLVFAQWHYRITLLLLGLVMVAVGVIIYVLYADYMQHGYSKKRWERHKRIFLRCTLIAVSAVCMIPTAVAVVVYDLRTPSYTADAQMQETLFSEQQAAETEDIYEMNRALFQCFTKAQWDSYTIQEKITIMQELVDFETKKLGIPTIPVTATGLDDFTLGKYNETQKAMYIDTGTLEEAAVADCVTTICHEVYHAFQSYIVNQLDWENAAMQSSYFDELRSWKENQKDYKVSAVDGYAAYYEQPLEASAREYAQQELNRIQGFLAQREA